MLYLTQLLMLLCAQSVDSFATGLAYSARRIKIPTRSKLLISLICSAVIGAGLELGEASGRLMPPDTALRLSAGILGVLGFVKIFEVWIKNFLKINSRKYFRLFSFNFFIEVICDSTQADLDCSKELSLKEAYPLAAALSLDGLAAGMSAGLTGFSTVGIFVLSFFLGVCALYFGEGAGKHISEKSNSDLSWISSAVMLILALLKLL